jgi:hypothetical protein
MLSVQVSVLRALSPGISTYELHCLLAVLAGSGGEAGKVTMAKLKQAIKAISYAQAFPVSSRHQPKG